MLQAHDPHTRSRIASQFLIACHDPQILQLLLDSRGQCRVHHQCRWQYETHLMFAQRASASAVSPGLLPLAFV